MRNLPQTQHNWDRVESANYKREQSWNRTMLGDPVQIIRVGMNQ